MNKTNKTNCKINNKIKVNVYLCAPSHVYYEMMIQTDDTLCNLLNYIQTVLPKNKYAYDTDNPIFFDMDTNTQLDPSKSFANQHIGDGSECSIKIKLKVIKINDA